MRVLITSAPMHGHLFPLVPLAWALRAAGHEVLVACTEHFVPTVTQAGLPAVSSGPGMDIRDLMRPDAPHGIEDDPYGHGEVFATMASRNLAGTLATVRSWRPDLVLAERSEYAGPVAARAEGVPYVELHWGVAELVEYRAAAETVLRGDLHRLGLTRLPRADLVLDPWPPSLRLPHARAHLGLRPVPYNGAARVPEWLLDPSSRPRIGLTMGTVLPQLTGGGMGGLLGGLVEELAGLDAELVLAIDDEAARELPPLPSAVRHAGRIPLSELVATCRLLIHHGGQGSALTALAAGCPQIVLPKFDDALENAEAIAAAGVGVAVRLDVATPRAVADAAGLVLGRPRFAAAAAAVAREVAAQPSPAETVAALERLVRRDTTDATPVGGSSARWRR
ncbi:nucleotide disphospho-sugar-binding domain-containing protein [Micromonospora wenchangensis]|uniref:nucleotide disphospho-sugar-binding domain-containing protein n=1 Tax=Micromonospora wenchangensis TaxID=1185415 RepID=UPI003D71FD96